MALTDMIAAGRTVGSHHPWPRVVVTPEGWCAVARQIAAGEATLLGLWGDAGTVHLAMIDEASGNIAVVTVECLDQAFPSVGSFHPPAIRLERAVQSLFGLEADGLPDPRPWLDLGFWGVKHPLGVRSAAPATHKALLPSSGRTAARTPWTAFETPWPEFS